jgi:hypothetical protein
MYLSRADVSGSNGGTEPWDSQATRGTRGARQSPGSLRYPARRPSTKNPHAALQPRLAIQGRGNDCAVFQHLQAQARELAEDGRDRVQHPNATTLGRRIPTSAALTCDLAAYERWRNRGAEPIRWQFTT